jgi:hypothetical protein
MTKKTTEDRESEFDDADDAPEVAFDIMSGRWTARFGVIFDAAMDGFNRPLNPMAANIVIGTLAAVLERVILDQTDDPTAVAQAIANEIARWVYAEQFHSRDCHCVPCADRVARQELIALRAISISRKATLDAKEND